MTARLGRFALQLWIVLFIVFFGAEVIHLEPTLRVVTQVMYGVPLAAWALLRLRGPADRLDWTLLGLLALYAAICVFSRDRTESLGTLGLATAYAAWFALLRRERRLQAPIALAIATGLALTLAFNAYLAIREKIDWYAAVGAAPLEGLVTFPWEAVNTLPVLVLLAIPFLMRLEPGVVRTVLAAVIGLSAVVVIPISNGRAGYIGLAVAGLAYAALNPASGRLVRGLSGRRLAAWSIGLAAAIVLGLVVVGPRFVDALGTSGRLLIWEQGLNMIAASPLIGSGPGVYSWVRMEFPPAGADLLALRLLHNVPLLTMVEGGVVLLAGNVVALAAWGAAALARRQAWGTPERATVAALVGFAAASLLDDFSFLPAVVAAVLALGAFLTPAESGRGGWLTPAVIALAGVASLPSLVAVDVARAGAQDARTAMVDGAYSEALAGFETATRAHPENGGYWLGLGMAAAYAGDEERAITAYERSIQAAPGDSRGYAALAHLGPAEERIANLEAAAARTLDDPQDAARLGVALAEQGDLDRAIHSWARAVALRPEVVRLLPYDEMSISDAVVTAEAKLLVLAEPRPAPGENDAALWDIGLAMDALPSAADLAWRAVHAARHGDLERALTLASDAVAEAPTDARSYQAMAAVAAFNCDAEAERAALELESHAVGAWVAPDPEPRAVREFIYREASMGPSQPPGARLDLRVERWPWSLVDRPVCSP
jgi:tetratricopeptide (TPR) repeat protein